MSVRDDLEAALQQRWDRETLAVYGDHLASHDDPRGELVQFDVHAEQHGWSPAIERRRHELVRAWLGFPVDDPVWLRLRVRHGFVEDLRITGFDVREARALLDRVLTSPVGDRIRGITVEATAPVVAAVVNVLGHGRFPWLSRLALGHGDRVRDTSWFLSRDEIDRLVAATPHLARLDVAGENVFEGGGVSHPSVRWLRVSGLSAFGSLTGAGPKLPEVTHVDFACLRYRFGAHAQRPITDAQLHRMFPAHLLPALRSLSLSRNEPGVVPPLFLGGNASWFGVVARLAVTTQLERIALPSVRDERDVAAVRRLAREYPSLAISVARRFASASALADQLAGEARVRVAPAWPWLVTDSIYERSIEVDLPRDGATATVDLHGAIQLLEHRYATMSEDGRAAWTQLFDRLRRLGLGGAFPADVLWTALVALGDLGPHHRWDELRNALASLHPLPTTVDMRWY